MNSFDIPILFLVFNRPDTTYKVLQQIKKAKPKKLFIAADGPREGIKGEEKKCQEVREILANGIDWDCEVKTLYRSLNLGSGKAVSDAITWFFENVDHGIILEDDIYFENEFLVFCKEALQKYKDHHNVMHISGTNCVYPFLKADSKYYFSKVIHGWGWATWKRAWDQYRFTLVDMNEEAMLNKLKKCFNDAELITSLSNIFLQVKNGPRNIWDYQWFFRIIYSDGIAITPAVNLTLNIGFGGDATHTANVPNWYQHVKISQFERTASPLKMIQNQKADRFYLRKYFAHRGLFQKIIKNVKRRIQ